MECCCACDGCCCDWAPLFPWRKKIVDIDGQPDTASGLTAAAAGGDKGNAVVIDYHFRGRVDSCASLETDNPSAVTMDTVTVQPPSHKRSLSSLDSALLASASGILSQALSGASEHGPHLQLSLSYEPVSSHEAALLVFLLSLRHYSSPAAGPAGGAETAPLLPMPGTSPAVMIRLSLAPCGPGASRAPVIQFSSIQTRSRNPVWKETVSLDGLVIPKPVKKPSSSAGGSPASSTTRHDSSASQQQLASPEQKLVAVVYESNKFSRWTPVKVGSHELRDIFVPGTHNLTVELGPVNEDVQPYGEIKLCLCYNKASHRVYCDVLEIRSLLHWSLTKKGEYFVKVQFFDKKKITKMKKTVAMKPDATSLVSIFETVRAKVSLSSLDNLSVRLLVCDAKVIMADSTLYYLTFGQDNSSGAAETTYWSDFIREIPASGKKQWFSLHHK